MTRRSIGIVTTARSDFGCMVPVITAVHDAPDLELRLYVTGAHLSSSFGLSIEEVRGHAFADRITVVPCVITGHAPADTVGTASQLLAGFAQVFAESAPDLLVVMGDRYDIWPAVMAAVPFNIPVAHLSGGEETEGVIDNSIRHALTKLSHLHFPSQEAYGRRLEQMGEEPWRITVAGEPSLDILRSLQPIAKDDLFAQLDLDRERPVTMFTFHPETLNPQGTAEAISAVLAAAPEETQIVFSYPGADPGADIIIAALHAFCERRRDCRLHPSLGRLRYFSLLAVADCMVGNSSSGIIEAASFGLPVVNIGDRQKGRLAPANVIHTPAHAPAVAAAWRRALAPDFRAGLAGLANPYGDGHAAERIVARLKDEPLTQRLLVKAFHDLP